MASGKGEGLERYLKNEETFVVEVYSAAFQQVPDISVVAGLIVDGISTLVILECVAGDYEIRIGYNFVCVRTRLQ